MKCRWSKIASCLPGRTDNEIKNVWNTHLKKRLINQKDSDHIAAKLESSSTNSSSFSPSSSSSLSTSSIPPVKEDKIQGSEPKPAFCSSSSSISSSSSSSSAPNYSNSISAPTDDHVPIPKDEMGINNSLDNRGGGTTTTTTTTTCEGFNSSDQQVIEIPTDDQYSEIDLWDMLGVPMQTNEYYNFEGSKFGEEYDLSRDLEWREWLRSMENRLGIEELAATSNDRDHDIVINSTTKDGPAGQGNSHFQMWPSPPQNFGF